MSETINLQKPVSDTKQIGCEHNKKLNCPACEGKFCPSCLCAHVGIHMGKQQTFI